MVDGRRTSLKGLLQDPSASSTPVLPDLIKASGEVAQQRAERFFAAPIDPNLQADMCSESFFVEFMHSWPEQKVQNKDDFFATQRSIQKGCPDWDYRAKIWKPTNGDVFEVDEIGNILIHFTVEVQATHTDMLELEGNIFTPTDFEIRMPVEWVTLCFSNTDSLMLDRIECRRVLDVSGSNTGGLCSVPGLLHFLGRPLPPPVTQIIAPIAPYTAPDNRDPNFKLRIQAFKQIYNKSEKNKKELRELLRAQMDEIQKHIDYLNSVRNYV